MPHYSSFQNSPKMKYPTWTSITVYLVLTFFTLSCGRQSTQDTSSSVTAKSQNETISELHPKDYPLVLRRTTLIVRDIDQALLLYKNAIGMEVIYDNIIKRPHKTEPREQEIRLVFLKATHEYVGVLGLVDYEYNNPNKIEKPVIKDGFSQQNSILMFNTHNLESKFETIQNTPGIEIITTPKIREYPSYDGKNTIRVLVSTFYDADGFLVEFNELLDDIK